MPVHTEPRPPHNHISRRPMLLSASAGAHPTYQRRTANPCRSHRCRTPRRERYTDEGADHHSSRELAGQVQPRVAVRHSPAQEAPQPGLRLRPRLRHHHLPILRTDTNHLHTIALTHLPNRLLLLLLVLHRRCRQPRRPMVVLLQLHDDFPVGGSASPFLGHLVHPYPCPFLYPFLFLCLSAS